MHFNQMYIAGCSISDDETVCTGEMRGKAASPTVFWLLQREACSNWNGQGVPASTGDKSRKDSVSERDGERDCFQCCQQIRAFLMI